MKMELREFPVNEDALLPGGTSIGALHFLPGQYVDATGITKGKGCQVQFFTIHHDSGVLFVILNGRQEGGMSMRPRLLNVEKDNSRIALWPIYQKKVIESKDTPLHTCSLRVCSLSIINLHPRNGPNAVEKLVINAPKYLLENYFFPTLYNIHNCNVEQVRSEFP
ncbi:uncharacterized protein LOC105156801 [Sesamum indicum]|uniref:Uncharacterized protein LOC105156801 n=1 Tax=Sesamum indicum TaxID=4182 RepID=A0A8M8UNN1_SESIN|nr:uncharacterized protein LOC105156801 [Sesamum indicum]